MRIFFEMEYNYVLLLTLVMVVIMVLQSVNLVGVNLMVFKENGRTARIWTEIFVLLELFLHLYILICALYRPENVLIDFFSIRMVRYVFSSAFAICILLVFILTRRWQLVFLLLSSAVVSPVLDILLGRFYLYAYLASVGYLAVRAHSLTVFFNRKRRDKISAMSIMLAIDDLPSAVLVVNSDRRIILMNRQMQQLLYGLMGKLPNNMNAIYAYLLGHTIQPPDGGEGLDGRILYDEKTQIYWTFRERDSIIQNMTYSVIVASDITEEWKLTLDLREQTEMLKRQSAELQAAVDDMERECTAQEIITLKGMFHDVLGQKIALLLRTLQEHRVTDKDVVSLFVEEIPGVEAMARQKYNAEKRLDILVKTFAGIGVTLNVKGKFPDVPDYVDVYLDIMREASTNAVRHGFAKKIDIIFSENEKEYIMRITNDGIAPVQNTAEGTGIKGMRKKVVYVGGYLLVSRIPEFTVTVVIPKVGA